MNISIHPWPLISSKLRYSKIKRKKVRNKERNKTIKPKNNRWLQKPRWNLTLCISSFFRWAMFAIVVCIHVVCVVLGTIVSCHAIGNASIAAEVECMSDESKNFDEKQGENGGSKKQVGAGVREITATIIAGRLVLVSYQYSTQTSIVTMVTPRLLSFKTFLESYIYKYIYIERERERDRERERKRKNELERERENSDKCCD